MSRITEYLTALKTVTSSRQFSLGDIPEFPKEEFDRLQTLYIEAEGWYSGSALEDFTTRSGKKVELYPVRINPIKAGVQKHAYALFGEAEEDDRPLVNAKVVFGDDGEKVLAEKSEEVLTQVWHENNGRAIQWENGAVSQVYGGCIFKLNYVYQDPLRTIPFQIEKVHPRFFVGVPDANDMWRLREAWVTKPITQEDARLNGYDGEFHDNDVPWLTEKWTPTQYKVWVNAQPARRLMSSGKWRDVSTGNTYGFVPIVYIPHIRIEGFYGENMFDVVKGVIRELNLRVADFGDAVNVDSHAHVAMKNVTGSPDVTTIAPGINAIDLGNAVGIVGNEQAPDMWEIRKAAASQAMEHLVDALYDQYRRDAFIPKVADGEDEGSQRSGLTLAMRMLSLLWHTSIERTFWTTGLNMFNRMILAAISLKEPKIGITQEHLKLRLRQDWSPVLPRDREMLVNEVVARITSGLGSPETLLDILGDVSDVDDEINRIIDFKRKVTKATTVVTPQQQKTKKVAQGTPTNQGKSSE